MASIARNRAIDVVRKKSEISIEEEPSAMEVAADSPDPLARLSELYAFRDPIYREVADFVVESDQEQVIRLAQRLEQQLRSAARA